MDKVQAGRNIKEVFENPFDEGRFHKFVKELLNGIDETKAFEYHGSYIPEAYREHIKQYKRIGQFSDAENNVLDILIVQLKKETSLERARTMQRNFVAHYLKNRDDKDNALVAYYTDGVEDWRFSFVRMDYREEKKSDGKIKIKTDLTPARRYSFLVGRNEPSHTAQQQLVPLLQDTETNPTLARIEQAFNIESVTKEFYQKYKELYLNLKDNCIEKKLKRSKQFREELNSKGIDEVSFTKKLLGQIVFLYFIQKKGWLGVPKDKIWGNGDRRYLRTLLDKAIASKQNFYADYLEYLFYQALATEHRGGSDPSYYKKLDCKIPFLNGGLFEADYDWEKTDITIPNNFFTNKNKTKEGDEGDGILDVLDRYNFTVKEDEPLEKEVAVDPEMLGKVFENLLEVKDRKSKGAYYTPREIVHYMCQESLINYLDVTLNSEPASYIKIGDEQTDAFGNKTKRGQLDLEAKTGEVVKVPKSDIEEFIRHGIAALENDVRVESKGKETDRYFYQIPQSIRTHAQDLDKALETIRICDPAIGSGAFPVGMMNEIIKARQVLDTYLKREHTVYDFKRHCIQECIYGVDIDHSAIDIAKLRLWLSLVVDEEDFYKIKPLPNLDYKIVEGNSLIGLPENVFPDLKTESEIEKLKVKFFEETDNEEKKKLRKQINEKIRKLLDSAEEFSGYHVDFDFKLFFSEVFHEKKGFDVVIANPPYVSNKKMHKNKMQDEILLYKKLFFSMKSGNTDIYVLFIENSLSIIKKQGTIRLIIPNKFLIAKYSKAILDYVINNKHLTSIDDFSNVSVFESASVYPIIVELRKSVNTKVIRQLFTINDNGLQVLQQKEFDYKELTINKLQSTKEEQPLIDKIINQSIPLGNELVVSPGINGFQFTNYGKCIFDKSEKNLSKTKCKKLIISGSIDRYVIKDDPIRYNKRRLSDPVIVYDAKIISSGKWELFESPKIVIAGMATKIEAYYDEKGELASGVNVYSIFESKSLSFKYILAYLNSRLGSWLFRNMFYDKHLGGDYISINATLLKKIPIKIISNTDQNHFAILVDKILEAKKSDANANTTSLEREIDVMVYKLYGLTEEERRIVCVGKMKQN
jgi:methylase of polypeptide subunit release factors